MMKKVLALLALVVPLAAGAAGSTVQLDKAPVDVHDKGSLQRGAKLFTNYCLSCHSASAMRYSRLQEIGLTEAQIKEHLLFNGGKVGDTMTISMRPDEAKAWFGAAPPDLSVIARSRGADWLYTYMRGFYKDETWVTGWNNIAFDKVAMPHVMADLQGVQVLNPETHKLELREPGKLSPQEYNAAVADLTNYLVWMGEPAQSKRVTTGILVLLFLGVFLVVAYLLKKEYWKDVH